VGLPPKQGKNVTDETIVNPVKLAKEKMQLSADEAKLRSETERRRSLEVRASFYDKLSALDAGSIAVTVSVGVALLGKPDSRFGSAHSHLTWLLWIAGFLWVSLICSVGHNSIFVNIARLEAENAKAWSNYLALLSAGVGATGEVAEILSKHIVDTLHQRIMDAAMNAHRTEQSAYRNLYLGKIAVATFLMAYTLVMVAVIHLWWITR
jgi:hypothetical protein